MEDEFYTFKIVVVGYAGVGKTSLVKRFVKGKFTMDTKQTIGVDFSLKNLTVQVGENKEILVATQIWDMAGEDRFRRVLPFYCTDVDGILLVFDCTKPETLFSLDEWLTILMAQVPETVPKLLASSKNDLQCMVSIEDIQQFVEKNKLNGYFKTSSVSGNQVHDVFLELATRILNQMFKF